MANTPALDASSRLVECWISCMLSFGTYKMKSIEDDLVGIVN